MGTSQKNKFFFVAVNKTKSIPEKIRNSFLILEYLLRVLSFIVLYLHAQNLMHIFGVRGPLTYKGNAKITISGLSKYIRVKGYKQHQSFYHIS
jgi:hypothetical protein